MLLRGKTFLWRAARARPPLQLPLILEHTGPAAVAHAPARVPAPPSRALRFSAFSNAHESPTGVSCQVSLGAPIDATLLHLRQGWICARLDECLQTLHSRSRRGRHVRTYESERA